MCIISKPWVNSNWSYSPETLNSGQNRQFCLPCDLEIWRMSFKNIRAPPLSFFKLCASFRTHWWIQTGVTVWKRPNLGQNRWFFEPCDLGISRVTLKNYRTPLPYYIKLCASFQSHEWIQYRVTVRKRSIRVKIGNFLSRATLKFSGWPWKQ